MTPKRRVVVTGVGLVSPLGIGTEETWQGLLAGRSGAAPITLFDASQHSTRIAGEVKGFDPLRFVEKKDVKKIDRFIQFAIAAAEFALADPGSRSTAELAPGVGVYIGSGIGGFATIEREHSELLKGGPRRISPFFIPAAIVNLASGWVSIRSGRQGAELGHGHGLHHRRPRRRRLVPPDPARRRGRDDRRRHRGGDHAARRRRLLRDARALDAQRRARDAPRGPSTGTATAS